MKAIDFETYLISEEQPAPKPVCLSWATLNGSGLIVGHDDMEAYLRKILSGMDQIIAHSAEFECRVIHAHFPKLRPLLWTALDKGRIYCTKLGEKIKTNSEKKKEKVFNLAHLVEKYFDEDISDGKKDPDAWRLRYAELDGVPLSEWPQAAVSYAIDDSIWALKVRLEQKGVNCGPAIRGEFSLNLMANTGLTVDKERVKMLKEDIGVQIDPIYDFLIEKGMCVFNEKTGKYQKKMKLLREHIEKVVPQLSKTAKGVTATDADAMKSYRGQVDDPIIQAFSDIAVFEKITSAYIPTLMSCNPLLRSTYNGVVVTNRTSCSGAKKLYPSMNLQQLPRGVPNVRYDVRGCIVPRPGYRICSIDYSGLEMASCANQLHNTFGASKMLELLNKGDKPFDMHSNYAKELLGLEERRKVSYEEFVSRKKEPKYKRLRQTAKPVNLSFPGGVGYDTMRTLMAQDNIVPGYAECLRVDNEPAATSACRELKKKGFDVRVRRVGPREWAVVCDELLVMKRELFKLYPELERFLKDYHRNFLMGEKGWKKNEYGEWEEEDFYSYTVSTPDGESFTQSYCTYTAACNGYLMQTPSAIGAKRAMYRIIKEFDEDIRMIPLVFIHDEIVFEVLDNDDKYDIIKRVSQIMIEEMQSVLPKARIAVEADLMPYWMKACDEWNKAFWKSPGGELQWD